MGMKTDSRKIIEFLAIGMEGNKKTNYLPMRNGEAELLLAAKNLFSLIC